MGWESLCCVHAESQRVRYFTYIPEDVSVLLGALGVSSIHLRVQHEASWFCGMHIDGLPECC